MSDNTVNAAMRRTAFTGDEMIAHGFRAMARTLMIERLPGIAADVIEAQLAHGNSGPLGAAYDHAAMAPTGRWGEVRGGIESDNV